MVSILCVMRKMCNISLHVLRVAASISLKIAYGYNIKEDEPDEIHKLVEKVMESFIAASTPGSFMVDSWPARTSPIPSTQ